MERDFETLGAVLIKTKFGLVSATKDNFSISVEEMIENKAWQEEVRAETGVFSLVPDKLDIPF